MHVVILVSTPVLSIVPEFKICDCPSGNLQFDLDSHASSSSRDQFFLSSLTSKSLTVSVMALVVHIV